MGLTLSGSSAGTACAWARACRRKARLAMCRLAKTGDVKEVTEVVQEGGAASTRRPRREDQSWKADGEATSG